MRPSKLALISPTISGIQQTAQDSSKSKSNYSFNKYLCC